MACGHLSVSVARVAVRARVKTRKRERKRTDEAAEMKGGAEKMHSRERSSSERTHRRQRKGNEVSGREDSRCFLSDQPVPSADCPRAIYT